MVMNIDKELNQKGLIMIKENPDDSVREEQSEVLQSASGTEDATQAKSDQEADIKIASDTKADATDQEEVVKIEKPKRRKRAPVKTEEPDNVEEFQHPANDTDLPPVDYSGFSKHELVETLVLLIENRPPAEIKDDVERIKNLFYKKIRQEADELKSQFLEGGGKIEEYRAWVDPEDARVKHLLDKYRERKTDYRRYRKLKNMITLRRNMT